MISACKWKGPCCSCCNLAALPSPFRLIVVVELSGTLLPTALPKGISVLAAEGKILWLKYNLKICTFKKKAMTFCVQNQIWCKLLIYNEICEQIHNFSYSGYRVQGTGYSITYCCQDDINSSYLPVIPSNCKKSASYEDRLMLSGRLISSKDCESSSSLREEGSFSNSSSANSFR